MLEGLDLEPHTVLGVPRDASMDMIREAFRRKSLKHHPDRGGDDWAFRIVVRAYQALTQPGPEIPATLDTAATRTTPTDLNRGDVARMATPPGGRWSPLRPGVRDRGVERSRLVQVEVVWVQSDVGELGVFNPRAEDRRIGGSLTLTWPDPELPGDPRGIPFADRILLALNAAFDDLRARTGSTSARSHIESGRFEAWLQYRSGPLAHEGFKHLHTNLKARGLGVQQWSRILTLPRGASQRT